MYSIIIFRYGVSCSLRLVLTDMEFLYRGNTLTLLPGSVMLLTIYLYTVLYTFCRRLKKRSMPSDLLYQHRWHSIREGEADF